MLDIKENVLFKELTSFRVGGPARFFVEVENEGELVEALNYTKMNNLPYFIFGGGCNILASEQGFKGLVIRVRDTRYTIKETKIECGAGLPLSRAVSLATAHELAGLEWAAGIPGAIGGAVRGNAGAFGSDMSQIIEAVKVLEVIGTEWQPKIYTLENCEFGYRDSIFKRNSGLIVLSATLKLKKGEKTEIDGRVKEIIQKRGGKQPQGAFSAGSFFVNPVVENQNLIEEFEKESGAVAKGGVIPAGWLVERVDLKGFRIGGAKISEEHGNFIINTGDATAEDVAMLGSIIKRKVRDELGVQLIEEVQLVGF